MNHGSLPDCNYATYKFFLPNYYSDQILYIRMSFIQKDSLIFGHFDQFMALIILIFIYNWLGVGLSKNQSTFYCISRCITLIINDMRC